MRYARLHKFYLISVPLSAALVLAIALDGFLLTKAMVIQSTFKLSMTGLLVSARN